MRELTKHEKQTLQNIIDDIDCGLLRGEYDAIHGDKKFMSGILTTMEFFAYLVGNRYGDEFSHDFIEKMLDSEEKV